MVNCCFYLYTKEVGGDDAVDPAFRTAAAARRRSGIRTSCCALAPVKTSSPCLSALCSVSALIFFSRIFFFVLRISFAFFNLQLPSFFLRRFSSSFSPCPSPPLPSALACQSAKGAPFPLLPFHRARSRWMGGGRGKGEGLSPEVGSKGAHKRKKERREGSPLATWTHHTRAKNNTSIFCSTRLLPPSGICVTTSCVPPAHTHRT